MLSKLDQAIIKEIFGVVPVEKSALDEASLNKLETFLRKNQVLGIDSAFIMMPLCEMLLDNYASDDLIMLFVRITPTENMTEDLLRSMIMNAQSMKTIEAAEFNDYFEAYTPAMKLLELTRRADLDSGEHFIESFDWVLKNADVIFNEQQLEMYEHILKNSSVTLNHVQSILDNLGKFPLNQGDLYCNRLNTVFEQARLKKASLALPQELTESVAVVESPVDLDNAMKNPSEIIQLAKSVSNEKILKELIERVQKSPHLDNTDFYEAVLMNKTITLPLVLDVLDYLSKRNKLWPIGVSQDKRTSGFLTMFHTIFKLLEDAKKNSSDPTVGKNIMDIYNKMFGFTKNMSSVQALSQCTPQQLDSVLVPLARNLSADSLDKLLFQILKKREALLKSNTVLLAFIENPSLENDMIESILIDLREISKAQEELIQQGKPPSVPDPDTFFCQILDCLFKRPFKINAAALHKLGYSSSLLKLMTKELSVEFLSQIEKHFEKDDIPPHGVIPFIDTLDRFMENSNFILDCFPKLDAIIKKIEKKVDDDNGVDEENSNHYLLVKAYTLMLNRFTKLNKKSALLPVETAINVLNSMQTSLDTLPYFKVQQAYIKLESLKTKLEASLAVTKPPETAQDKFKSGIDKLKESSEPDHESKTSLKK